MKQWYRVISMLAACAMLALLACAVTAEDGRQTQLVSVRLSEDGKTLEVDAVLSEAFLHDYGTCGVYLFEFDPQEKFATINQKAPIAQMVAASELAFRVDFTEQADRRKYCKYVLAREVDGGYRTFATAKYIENPEVLAASSAALPEPEGLAGVSADVGVSSYQGLSQAVVRVSLSALLADSVDGAVRFEYGESAYYLDKEELIRLDNRVRALSSAGVCVYLQTVLDLPATAVSQTAQLLYADSDSRGSAYAVNTASAESCEVYAALMEFLCERYTRDDQAYGFAGRFIFGDSVNLYADRYAGAPDDLSDYLYDLCRTLRIASTALRGTYTNARLYLSLSGDYTAAPEGGFAAAEVLNGLCASLSDLPFGISVDGTAEGASARFWEDEDAAPDPAARRITVKNIAVLADALRTPELLHGGRVRDLVIGQFRADAGEDRNLQAASVLCAYYLTETTSGVSALLCAYLPTEGGTDGLADGQGMPTRAYQLLCETAVMDDAALTDRVRMLLGDDEYERLAGGVLSELFVSRTRLSLHDGSLPRQSRGEYLADFADGSLYNFSADSQTESAASAILTEEGIVLALTGKADRAGMVRDFRDYTMDGIDLIVLDVMAKTDDPETAFTLSLTGQSEGEPVVLYGTTELTSGQWTRVAFDLAGIDVLEHMAVEAVSGARSDLTLYVHTITLYHAPQGISDLAVRVIVWVLAIVTAVFLALWLILLRMRTRARPQPIHARYTYTSRQTGAPAASVPERRQKDKPFAPAKERGIPEMPKTKSKTFVVPAKQQTIPKRDTMSLGIEPTDGNESTGFDTTAGTEHKKQQGEQDNE